MPEIVESPQDAAQLIQPGSGEKFRGSSEIPLTPEGIRGAMRLGMQLAQKGGLHELQASSMGRTVHTAKILSHYTHAPITYVGDGPHPWHLGGLEGQKVTPELLDYQNRLIKHEPDEQIPGRGPVSVADGESFNQFKQRALGYLQDLMAKSSANPHRAIGVVTHYRVKKLLDAWMRKGTQPDGTVDSEYMTAPSEHQPGGVDRLVVDPNAGPQMYSVDTDSPGRLSGGIYLIRHESTPWNSKQS